MSNPESKPLTKQSYQTVPDITLSDEEEPLTNNTERAAESYKRKYGYAVLTSGILFVLLMASAAFNNKDGGKIFASHLKTSHIVPVEGSGDCSLTTGSADQEWTVEFEGEAVKKFYLFGNFVGFSHWLEESCIRPNGALVGKYDLADDGFTHIDYKGHGITVAAYGTGDVELLLDSTGPAGFSAGYDCHPIDLVCMLLLSDTLF